MIYIKNEIELLWRSNQMSSMKKTKQDNNMIDHTNVVYIENNT